MADRHLDYAYRLENALKNEGIRVKVDGRSERINLKIRQAQLDKTPYMLVIGDKEVAAASVSVRLRSGEQIASQTLESFIKEVRETIDSRAKDLNLFESV